jgi:hypothetical protein
MRGTLGLAVVLAGVIAAPAAAEEVNLAGPGFVPVTVADGVDAAEPALGAHPAWRVLPRARRAASIEVIASGRDGRWRTVWRIALGGRAEAADRMPP